MRRRDRFRNLAWLQWMDGDSGDSTGRIPPGLLPSVSESLGALIRQYRRYVDFEQLGTAFRVRVIPAHGSEEMAPLNFGLCYAGPSLPALVATAVVELDLIAGGETAYRVGIVERWRWVPC